MYYWSVGMWLISLCHWLIKSFVTLWQTNISENSIIICGSKVSIWEREVISKNKMWHFQCSGQVLAYFWPCQYSCHRCGWRDVSSVAERWHVSASFHHCHLFCMWTFVQDRTSRVFWWKGNCWTGHRLVSRNALFWVLLSWVWHAPHRLTVR